MKHRNPSPTTLSVSDETQASLPSPFREREGTLRSPKGEDGEGEGPSVEKQLQDTLERLHGLYPKLIDLSLERLERLLEQLGNPHLKLPPTIHVAGTNGKGSTIAALRSIIEASGYSAHVMTSPHLVRINERIRIAGALIESESLIGLLEECMGVNQNQPITFFEIMTAATFLAFARTEADFCLIETGLGGRYDASNVIQNPVATILTMISYDHQEFLGDTMEKIAFEKAGIIKPGAPCIIARQAAGKTGEKAINTISSQALSTDAAVFIHGSNWSIEPNGGHMRFRFEEEVFDFPCPNLIGDHQIDNAGAALATWRIISGEKWDEKKISTGLGQIDWPGRLQRLEGGKLVDMIRPGWEVWIDGGHNESAGKALSEQAKHWAAQNPKPLHLVLGMMRRKDPKAFLDPLVNFTESVSCIPVPGEKDAFEPQDLAAYVPAANKAPYIHTDAPSAIRNLVDSEKPGRILITGSLYLIGNILQNLPKMSCPPKAGIRPI